MSTESTWYAGRRISSKESSGTDFLAELNDQPWAGDALCAQTDPESFYPEKGGSTREAKAVCASCDVRAECLAYAVEHQERYGIWGGLSERERRRLKAAPDAAGRPCARPACTETIPATTSPSKRYHDRDCGRLALDEFTAADLDHDDVLDAYLVDGVPIGRIATRHQVQASVIALILDQHDIGHTVRISRARRAASKPVREASA